MDPDKNISMIIEITNLTIAQKMAIEDMLSYWILLGSVGSSRWTSFFADGDGNFKPKITVNGNDPEFVDENILPSWMKACRTSISPRYEEDPKEDIRIDDFMLLILIGFLQN